MDLARMLAYVAGTVDQERCCGMSIWPPKTAS